MYLLTSFNLSLKAEIPVLSIHLPFLVTYSVQIYLLGTDTSQTLYNTLGFNGEQNTHRLLQP